VTRERVAITVGDAVKLRAVEPRDEARWRPLWDAYSRFWGRAPDEAITRRTWANLHDPAAPVHGLVADHAEAGVVAIAHYLIHESTSTLHPVCYLQDLFVDEAARGGGLGKRMIDWLIAEMAAQGWSRLYWHTRETNYRARSLYDKYGPHSGRVRYVVDNPAG
jgi:GNAT superfamily N-acetyltransferase